MSEMFCCHISDDDTECASDAEWLIEVEGSTFEDYTHACTEHVGELLGTTRIEESPNPAYRITNLNQGRTNE